MNRLLPIMCLGVLLLAGCGAENDSASTPRTLGEIEIVAEDPVDEKTGADLRRYMIVNCPPPGTPMPPMRAQWGPRMPDFMKQQFEAGQDVCSNVRSIEVDDSRLTVTSGLKGDDLEDAGAAFCNLVRGSDVADFTPGHELQDASGETITVCGTRNAYR